MVACLYISVALQQKTANFNVAVVSRHVQWSDLSEGKQKNKLSQIEFRLLKTIIIIIRGAITRGPSPPNQR